MKLRVFLTLIALASFTVSCATKTSGDFCGVAVAMIPDTPEVADYIDANDPRLSRSMIAHNIYGERKCDWKF